VRASKTDAGIRQIDLLPTLRDELEAHKAHTPSTTPGGYVFATIAGTEPKQGNIRRRVLDKAVELNERLTEAGDVPLPEGLTPHKLRHTFASILVALGVDPGSVMDQLGHTDPGFTLRVYRQGMRRDGAAREHLRALVGTAESDYATSSIVVGEPNRSAAWDAAGVEWLSADGLQSRPHT
jgi:integrase